MQSNLAAQIGSVSVSACVTKMRWRMPVETAVRTQRSAGPRQLGVLRGFGQVLSLCVHRLMYTYVLWNNESFLINHSDPEWPHIESFKWWLLPHGLAAACALFLGLCSFQIGCGSGSPSCTAFWVLLCCGRSGWRAAWHLHPALQ